MPPARVFEPGPSDSFRLRDGSVARRTLMTPNGAKLGRSDSARPPCVLKPCPGTGASMPPAPPLNLRADLDWKYLFLDGRGENRPVVKLCSPYFFYIKEANAPSKCSEWIPAFTTRVDQTNGSTLVKLILFEKSRVELEFVVSIFTTRVRKHLGNSVSLSLGFQNPKIATNVRAAGNLYEAGPPGLE